MKRIRKHSFKEALRMTDLPHPKWWAFGIRFLKTMEVLIFKLLQIFDLYRPQKSVLVLPSLSTKFVTSIQAVTYNGTQDEVLGFHPRRLLHRILRGLPDTELYERVRFSVKLGKDRTETIFGSSETRGFIHLQVPWTSQEENRKVTWIQANPEGVDTLLGPLSLGDYETVSAPLFFLNSSIKYIIVSDIDDTIKDSKIAETTTLKQILRGIFKGHYYTYDAIAGMAELYQKIASNEVLFVYVTSTPYQLAPFLMKFLRSRGFPEGPVFPRWLGYGQFGHKWRTLQRLLNGVSNQKILLIGDSGEQDLQIYRRLCESPQYDEKIVRILIRHIPGTPLLHTQGDKEKYYRQINELELELENCLKNG